MNASKILNFGCFVHRIRTRALTNPLVEHQSVGWRLVHTIFPALGVYQLEDAIVNVPIEVERGFNDTSKAISNLQSELDSLVRMVIQNRKAMGILLAQQGGTHALIHEECCLYVNKSGTILSNLEDLKGVVNVFHQIGLDENTDFLNWLPSLGGWGKWIFSLIGFLFIIVALLILLCCFIKCAFHAFYRPGPIPFNPPTIFYHARTNSIVDKEIDG